MTRLRVSIDGASATGKTTLGLRLAQKLGAVFLDTGLTYRTAAMLASRSLEDRARVSSGEWLESFTHRVSRFPASEVERVYVEGEDVTDDIWSSDIDQLLSELSQLQSLRSAILNYHAALISDEPAAVVAGRDVATALLPDATLNIVLTAQLTVREQRRREQYRLHPGRSIAITQPSALDKKVMQQTAAQSKRWLIIDTSDLSPFAIYERVLHELY